MQLTLEDDLVSAARLTESQARLTLALKLFAEDRLTLLQAARLAGLHRLAFQGELTARQIPWHYGEDELKCRLEHVGEKPWLALCGSARFTDDPVAPVFSDAEIYAPQKEGSNVGS